MNYNKFNRNTKNFNTKTPEQKERLAMFKEVMRDFDKRSIIDAFEVGLEVGFFGKKATINDILDFQFTDDKYVYKMRRIPIQTFHKLQQQSLNNQLSKIDLNKLGIKELMKK